VGRGVWKYWFCSFSEIWEWFAHEATNHDRPEYYIFCRDVSFQECFIVGLAFWKRKHVYIQWFWCLQWILHYIVVHITICTHRLFDKFIVFFTIVYFFSKNMYLILNRH
jgi:hypothetical protein